MASPVWIATILGLAGGLALTYALGKAILPRMVARSAHASLLVRLAFAGTVIAVLPALFLSLVVGGTLGGAWGRHTFAQLGFPLSGVPIGLAFGVATVFALVMIAGAVSGVALGKAVVWYRHSQDGARR